MSIAVHVIALPILAHFGAFEKIERHFGASRVVLVNNPVLDKPKSPEAKEKKAAKPDPAKHAPGAGNKTGHKNSGGKPNPNAPKVVASAGDAGGVGGDGPTVDANAGGKAGVIPTEKPATSGGTGGGGGTAVTPAPTPEPVVHNNLPVKPVEPKPTAPVVVPHEAPKHVAKFEPLETVTAPEPEIPDSLRNEPFEKTQVVEATVGADGVPTEVKTVESTGVSDLDRVGLDTARKYRFHPARLDGEAVVGRVRFRIIFKVE